MKIPRPVIASVAAALADIYSHTGINKLANVADVDPDRLAGTNKEDRSRSLLESVNEGDGEPPLTTLGRILEEMMDGEDGVSYRGGLVAARDRINGSLLRAGLVYLRGGIVGKGTAPSLSRSVEGIVKARSLAGVGAEYERIFKNLESDPPAAVTASCALLEALLKSYIEGDADLTMPSDQSVGPLWKVIKGHLHLDPGSQGNEDLKKILSGLSSIADGLGAFRTHHGSAHGRATVKYRVLPRHARLAAHACLTLCTFIIETMEERGKGEQP
jgi:Abortive infection C-terminus